MIARFRLIALWGAIGFVISVLVTWLIAYFAPIPQGGSRVNTNMKSRWMSFPPRDFGEVTRAFRCGNIVATTWQIQRDLSPITSQTPFPPQYVLNRKEIGVPFRCLFIQQSWLNGPYSKNEPVFYQGLPIAWRPEWIMKYDTTYAEAFPVAPIWRGFILNILFYSMISFGVRTMYLRYRARRRLRLGHCPFCNYDMKSLSKCPECGAERGDQTCEE